MSVESAYCTDVNLTERRVFCSSLNHYMTALQLAVVEYMYTCVLKNILYICSGGEIVERRREQRFSAVVCTDTVLPVQKHAPVACTSPSGHSLQ